MITRPGLQPAQQAALATAHTWHATPKMLKSVVATTLLAATVRSPLTAG